MNPDESDSEVGDLQDEVAETDGNMTIDFGFIRPLSIGSFVWEDADQDGLQDEAEPGIAGAVVTLLDVAGSPVAFDMFGTPITPITTDSSGTYRFDNLLPGDYRIQVVPPTPYLPSPVQNTDNNDTLVDNSNIVDQPSDNTYVTSLFTLTVGEEPAGAGEVGHPTGGDNQDDGSPVIDSDGNMTVDIGFVQAVAIGSTVFLDNNNDGLHGEDEPGIRGVTVQLFFDDNDPLGPPHRVTTTNQAGHYYFDDLYPDTYFVYIPTPPAEAPMSSTDIATSGDDNQVDGDDNGQQAVSGDPVRSPNIILAVATEPSGPG